ncbi:MAG: MBL fold metallo-hydrolase, partial [Pseudomonadota bacterium]
VVITHEHGDHYLGMDDLLAFRRAIPTDAWRPIPVYASARTWEAVQLRFGYLVGSLVEKREAVPGLPFSLGNDMTVTPFKTFHGPSAAGSVGYVFEDKTAAGAFKLVYTSDFMRLEDEPNLVHDPDVLVMQSHWLNEPGNNRPYHMSFQRAVEYIKRWKPRTATYLVHISDGEPVPGDPENGAMKKLAAEAPLLNPKTQEPYPVPRCHDEWQDVVNAVAEDLEIPGPIIVARDGMTVAFP